MILVAKKRANYFSYVESCARLASHETDETKVNIMKPAGVSFPFWVLFHRIKKRLTNIISVKDR